MNNYQTFLLIPPQKAKDIGFRVTKDEKEAQGFARLGFEVFKVQSASGFEIYRYLEL